MDSTLEEQARCRAALGELSDADTQRVLGWMTISAPAQVLEAIGGVRDYADRTARIRADAEAAAAVTA